MRTIVGTMTGTSMDGVDAVATTIDGLGLSMTASFVSLESCDIGESKIAFRKLASIGGTKEETDSAAWQIGIITAQAISQLKLAHIDLIALHGQTIFHAPPKSIQLINPTPITDSFSCPVLTDPRQADLKLGGQGAPITPLADWVMFRSSSKSTAIVNLGGFCNVTILPENCTPNQITGFDVCCCNLVLNEIARARLGCEYDLDGEEAKKGSVNQEIFGLVLQKLLEQCHEDRSLGTNDDIGKFIVEIGDSLHTKDLLATVVAAIGACITASTRNVDCVLLAGGGVHNAALLRAIKHDGTTEKLGVPTQAREAMAMAILGALAQDGVSITLSQITGRKETNKLVGWTQARP
jgi:anhydro-N-acetylmuramic acid kinase